MTVNALGYLRLSSERPLQEWKHFAEEVLGASVVEMDGTLRIRVDEKSFRIEVAESTESGLVGVGLDVGDEASLDELEASLASAGVPTRRGTSEECAKYGVLGCLYCDDPSGTPLELFYGQMYIKEKFISPQGVNFITGELGLGHALIRSPHYDASLKFYCDLLGFRITDIWNGSNATAAFLRCNERHHSIALRKAESDERPSIGHFMLEVDSVDAVGLATERGEELLTRTLGRHFNDEMLSCYFRTPSGFDVEYGTGGRRIDDDTWVVGQIDAPSGWGHKTLVR